jgi:isochorismate synthase
MTQVLTREITQTTETLLRKAMTFCVEKELSFAVWKLPHTDPVYFAASSRLSETHEVSLEDTAPGFLFSPFDPAAPKIFLPADELLVIGKDQLTASSGILATQLTDYRESPGSNAGTHFIRPLPKDQVTTQSSYHQLVEQCRDAVMSGSFEKLVPSRTKEVKLPHSFDLAKVFTQLCSRYPGAMVSIFSSRKTGTWIGATPETLVRVDAQQHFHTVAVAGTQKFEAGTDLRSITWTQKEIEEQALVERYIISCFKKIRLREFDEHGPKTVVAGNVVHLKTDFEVDMVATRYPQLGSVMLKLLHPTSAVCGMPMEKSLEFLRAHEGYDREYYSGYLGPVKINNESHLFVNLRCMQVSSDGARLYAGGGVLGESDPEKEWQETELKMNTLLNVIRD